MKLPPPQPGAPQVDRRVGVGCAYLLLVCGALVVLGGTIAFLTWLF